MGVAAKHPDGALVLRAYENHDYANDSYENRVDRVASDYVEASMAINFLIDGVPFLYNGNEFADGARHSLWSLPGDSIRIDWSTLESERGKRRMELVKKLCLLRHSEAALCHGATEWEKDALLAIFNRKYGEDCITVIANFNNYEISIPAIDGETLISGNVCQSGGQLTLSAGGYIAVKQ